MHEIVKDGLEDYLGGKAVPAVIVHLESCADCCEEMAALQNVSDFLAELHPDANAPQPSPFFYRRVAASIAEEQKTPSHMLLAPGQMFFRRVAFASLLMLAGLGSYLVIREGDSARTDAAAIMAQHQITNTHPAAEDRNLMLVTLASYQ